MKWSEELVGQIAPLVHREDEDGAADHVDEERDQSSNCLPDCWGVMRVGKEPVSTEEIEELRQYN